MTILPTSKLARTGLVLNPCHCNEKPPTNSLNLGTTYWQYKSIICYSDNHRIMSLMKVLYKYTVA